MKVGQEQTLRKSREQGYNCILPNWKIKKKIENITLKKVKS